MFKHHYCYYLLTLYYEFLVYLLHFFGKTFEGFNLFNSMRFLGREKMNVQHNYFVVVGLRSRFGGGPFLSNPFLS